MTSPDSDIHIDHFHLLKLDGRWWIIHKISTPC